jgi:hypothetical protein
MVVSLVLLHMVGILKVLKLVRKGENLLHVADVAVERAQAGPVIEVPETHGAVWGAPRVLADMIET